MNVEEIGISGALLFTPKVFGDDRGYFFESFREDVFSRFVPEIKFVQDNESLSAKHVVRGLHFQVPPRAQSKLVRVSVGRALDVIVDLRKRSPTYLKTVCVELSGQNKFQLFVPKGCAHGFLSLEDNTLLQYKVDEFYSKEHDSGIRFSDPLIKLETPLDMTGMRFSDKDQKLPFWSDLQDRVIF